MLRIDLLPGHFAAARAAKTWLVLMVLLLLSSIVGCFGWLMVTKGKLATVEAEYDDWHQKAEAVRKLEQDAGKIEKLAEPIDAKVEFIEAADGSGEPYWAAFDKVNRYVYARVRVLRFSIQAPSRVHFEVEIPDTTTCGRFVLNLIRCPDVSNIRFGGSIPSGPGVGPNAGGGGGGMGMGMGMGGPGMGMEGMPGEMPGMGGMPPMMGGTGMAPGGGGGTARAGGPIRLSVDADLKETINTPQPGAAGGGAAAGPGAGMMPGAPGGMMPGAPGGMMPGGGSGPMMGEGGGSMAPGGPGAGSAEMTEEE